MLAVAARLTASLLLAAESAMELPHAAYSYSVALFMNLHEALGVGRCDALDTDVCVH